MFTKVAVALAIICALFASLNAVRIPNKDKTKIDCPEVCAMLYAPVCASDGVRFLEFSNPCSLQASNCRLQRSSLKPFVVADLDMCRTELINGMDTLLQKLGDVNMEKPECLKICTLIYNPVCISNGKYRALAASPCVMDALNCALGATKEHFRVLQKDTC